MEFNNIAEGFELTVPSTVQTAFCDRTENAEIGQDFTLPDYQPEMRKLLRVSSVIQPPSRFLGIGEAEFSGNVIFTVLLKNPKFLKNPATLVSGRNTR